MYEGCVCVCGGGGGGGQKSPKTGVRFISTALRMLIHVIVIFVTNF